MVYPLSCLICKEALSSVHNQPLCAACWKKIKLNLPPFCPKCGKFLPSVAWAKGGLPAKTQDLSCYDCQRSSFLFKKANSACIYEGVVKQCVHLFKYQLKLSLAKPLAGLMIDFAREFLDMNRIDIIIPVPLQAKKKRQRQFNQSELLAQPLARAFNKELDLKTLMKTRTTTAQMGLSGAKRRKNIIGAFFVKYPAAVSNKRVLLIDDIFTTGSTVNECARTLLQAGAKEVEVFTLAAA